MSAGRFAASTKVPWEKSRVEVERVLMRYGASGFGYGWHTRDVPAPAEAHGNYCSMRPGGSGRNPCCCSAPKFIARQYVTIAFSMPVPVPGSTTKLTRNVQLEIPMPHEVECRTKARLDQLTRQRWRALVLVLKAKLEAVAAGISTLEHEFLADIVTPGGITIGAALVPRLSVVVERGLPMLPAANGD